MNKFLKIKIAALLVLLPMSLQSKPKTVTKIVLTSDNTLVLNDEINSGSVGDLLAKAFELDQSHGLARLSKSTKPLYLFLRTPGGEIQSGIEMIDALKGLDRPINTITSFAASMGFQTVQQLGMRYILKNGVLMSHRAKGGFEGEFGGQKPSQVDNRKNFWEKRIEEMDQTTVDRTNGKQTMESYTKAYSAELWLTGSQAVEQGYADGVVSVSCDDTLNGKVTKTASFQSPFGAIDLDYDIDKCPLSNNITNVRLKIPTTNGTMYVEDFLSHGGEFGVSCLRNMGSNPNKICALDTNITYSTISDLKIKFKLDYENIQNKTIPIGSK